jgi:hypothetical protein
MDDEVLPHEAHIVAVLLLDVLEDPTGLLAVGSSIVQGFDDGYLRVCGAVHEVTVDRYRVRLAAIRFRTRRALRDGAGAALLQHLHDLALVLRDLIDLALEVLGVGLACSRE